MKKGKTNGMKRLAIALLVALVPSGCIWVTPASGLRLGDHSQEFAAIQPGEVGASNVIFQGFAAPDFVLFTPTYWNVVTPPKQVTQGVLTGNIGVQVNVGETEGITFTEIGFPQGQDATQANAQLAQLVKSNLTDLSTSGTKSAELIAQTPSTLGNVPSVRTEVRTTNTSGAVTHYLAESAFHNSIGFVLVISTTERRFSTFLPVFTAVFAQFQFNPPVPGPGASSAPSALPSLAPGGTLVPIAGPSALPSAAPSQQP